MLEYQNPYRPTVVGGFLAVVLLCCSLVDIPNRLELGPFSGQAALTILYTLLMGYMWLNRPISSISLVHTLSFAYFLIWCLASFIWHDITKQGIQNIFVFMSFFGIILVVSREYAINPGLQSRIQKVFKISSALSILLYLPTLFLTGLGNGILISSRSFALFGLICLAYLLVEWRYSKQKFWFFASIGMMIIITLSLSRTAMVTGVVMMILSRYRFFGLRNKMKFFMVVFISIVLLLSTIFYFEPVKSRFFEGDTSMSIGAIPINAMGRTQIWETVLQSFWLSPIVGNGAGAAEEVLKQKLITETQPHNDYLRILHDYGIVGFSFWVIAFVGLLLATWRSWRTADYLNHSSARNHMAAFLAIVSIAFASMTDNVVVYIFVMAPAAILIGLSIGNKQKVEQNGRGSAVG
ncbi:O-antigen ligase family protein [Cohnella suwonensis]|uniref:O-antigen ligase family protein n=1 Tax=Cohnella suwonensis TaxID=696072 RepID=A0ABW0M3P0_9BACL